MSDFVIENDILIKYTGSGGDVVIPEGAEHLGEVFSEARYYGFRPPHPLTGAVLPESMTAVDNNAFTYCQFLKKVVLPDTLTKIGGYAFCDCAELTELTIPQSVTEIGERAFAGCKKLSITLPPKLKSIEEAAFRDCALTSIVIPDGVTQVGKDAFLRCNKIRTAGPVGGGYDYEFPWTEEIPDNAFSGLRKLKKAVLSSTIKKVGNNAFKDCKELSDLTMPKAAKVSKTAFKGCDKLGEIKEPDQAENNVAEVKKDNTSEFVIANGCLTLYKGHDADVIIPDGIKIIGRRAFYGNRDIESVTIPASVEEIEQGVFEYCYNLKKVTFLGPVKKVGVQAFGWMYNKPELEIQVYNSVAIHALTKSAQGDGVSVFCRRFSELDKNSGVFRDNLEFIGTHLKQKTGKVGRMFYEYLLENEMVRHAVMEADAIPAKDAEWLVAQLQPEKHSEIVAEILDYKNRVLKDPKKKKSLEKSKAREEEKELSQEMTAADWRKIFKFSYADGDVVIKETKISDRTITVPAYIGTKKVRIIDRGAFSFAGDKSKSPESIIISEGVEEIRRGAFLCVDDSEVFIPSTVTSLPEGTFIAVHNLIVHLPMAITEIAEELEWDSPEPAIKEIHAPAGSYTETYAKEHNITFIAE